MARPTKSPLLVDLNFPLSIRLALDSAEVEKKVGTKLATAIRKRLRKGVDAQGEALPPPKTGKRPLKSTGKLLRSIKYQRRLGFVAPSVRSNRDDISKRARSNFGLMSIQISGVFRKGSSASREPIDPMGAQADSTLKTMQATTTDEVNRQLSRGRAGLILELKRKARSAARREKFRKR